MTTAVALWSVILTPGTQYTFDAAVDLQLTNASLDETASGSERTVVKLRYIDENDESALDDENDEEEEDDDEIPGVDKEIVVTTLTAGKNEQAVLNLILAENESGYTFSVLGPNKVHLAGHYLIQHGKHSADSDDEDYDSEEDSEGGIYDDEVGLPFDGSDEDEEDEEDEDDEERFQELASPGKTLKRARPDDDELADISMATTTSATSLPATVDGVDVSTLSKNQRKKLAKKLKTDDGSAAEPAAAAKLGKHEVSKEKAPAAEPAAAAVPAKKEKEEKKEKAPAATAVAQRKKVTLPSGVTIEDAKIGSGPVAKSGSRVSMRYIGSLPSGKVFDKNTKGKPFEFKLGAGQVIKGWDDGIKGMSIGGERKLIIPPASAYGKKGAPPDIPANATLHFEVKLLAIK